MKFKDNVILDFNLSINDREELAKAYREGKLKTAKDDAIKFMNDEYYYTYKDYKFEVVKIGPGTTKLVAKKA